MRIALVTREYPGGTEWGGIGKFYGVFARALKEAGHEVEVFTQGIEMDCSRNEEGILVHRIVPRQWVVGKRVGGQLGGMALGRIGTFSLSLAAAFAGRVRVRHLAKPFDLAEGHEHLGVNALVNLYGRGRFTTITRYHTSYHTLVHRKLADWPVSPMITRLEKLSITSADGRTCASRFINLLAMEDFPGVSDCDAIIPLIPDTFSASPGPPIEHREKLMVFVGRMAPRQKNPLTAAQVFAKLAVEFPDWRIEFAGLDIPSQNGRTSWGECEAVLSRFPGRYKYHGRLAQHEVEKLYRRARIALIPSGFESFGLVALESMAAGTIPVVSDSNALPEVVGEAGVTFRCNCSDDLELKLRLLLPEERLQQELSSKAVDRVAKQYSRARILNQNLEFFREQIARNSAGWRSRGH